MKKNKKAFTLMELLIVIFIMSLFLWLSMGIWVKQLNNFKLNNIKENFIWFYNNIYNNILTSNYYKWKKINIFTISFNSNTGNIFYYETWYKWLENINYNSKKLSLKTKINNIYSNNTNNIKSFFIELSPYTLWCNIMVNWKKIKEIYFSLINEKFNKNYCFYIKDKNCILEEIKCINSY